MLPLSTKAILGPTATTMDGPPDISCSAEIQSLRLLSRGQSSYLFSNIVVLSAETGLYGEFSINNVKDSHAHLILRTVERITVLSVALFTTSVGLLW